MKMLIQGEWTSRPEKIEVRNPFDGTLVDTVPKATVQDVDAALCGAVEGSRIIRNVSAFERSQLLKKTADLMEEHTEDLARTISLEEGKILAEARVETVRATEIMRLCAEEAKRLTGEVLPLDAAPGAEGKLGFTVRVPCGVVAAITPFNFPLHLVCHKVGPALAGGNAVVVKPASDTPLSALKVLELLLEAGVPPLAIAGITGSGGQIGDALCADRRVRKITFTGSYEVGNRICKNAGMKRVTMELGSNAPLIVMDDADLEKVAQITAMTGYANAGQVCISTQRLLTDQKIHDDLLGLLQEKVDAIKVGNQLDESIGVGPMIRESDAVRVGEWVQEAVDTGARIVTGGQRDGALMQPTIVADVAPSMRVSCEELFGPAVAVTRFTDMDEAIALANDSEYGLSAGIFTQDIDRAMRFAREVDSGNIQINWGPQWRADLMPYGGLKNSGIGKEGPKYAVQEMTETKMVVVHLHQ